MRCQLDKMDVFQTGPFSLSRELIIMIVFVVLRNVFTDMADLFDPDNLVEAFNVVLCVRKVRESYLG